MGWGSYIRCNAVNFTAATLSLLVFFFSLFFFYVSSLLYAFFSFIFFFLPVILFTHVNRNKVKKAKATTVAPMTRRWALCFALQLKSALFFFFLCVSQCAGLPLCSFSVALCIPSLRRSFFAFRQSSLFHCRNSSFWFPRFPLPCHADIVCAFSSLQFHATSCCTVASEKNSSTLNKEQRKQKRKREVVMRTPALRLRMLRSTVHCGALWRAGSCCQCSPLIRHVFTWTDPRGVCRTLHTHNGAPKASAIGTVDPSDAGSSAARAGSATAASNELRTSATSATAPRRTVESLLFLPNADAFAQSRIKNYMQRLRTSAAPAVSETASLSGGQNHVSTTSSTSDVATHLLSKEEIQGYGLSEELDQAWLSSFQLPVDVFVDDRLARRHITAAGVAADAKTSVIAACMHAERCLDALRIPLFTSERRQHQRVLQAQAEGRTAAEVTDVPHALSQVTLPAPVFLPPKASAQTPQRLVSYQPTRTAGITGAGSTASAASTRVSGPGRDGAGGPHLPPHQQPRHRHAKQRKPPKRHENYTTRFGSDPFLQTTLTELAALQSTLFAHNRPSEGDADDDDGGSVDLAADEVAILQPELLPRGDVPGTPRPSDDAAHSRAASAPGAHSLMLEMGLFRKQKSHLRMTDVDESEGGVYDLVEGDSMEWWMEPEVPGPSCLRDSGAVARVDQYVRRVSGHSFADSVQIRYMDEDTFQFIEQKSRFGVDLKRWYTASLDLGEIQVRATGKATTQEAALDLCAMHAELLLQWFGVPLYTNPHAQALYYDACLKWGRHVAAAPIDSATVNLQTAKLPKPLKEWFRSRKTRKRCAERNVQEKLLLLNRIIVHCYRKHLLEVDVFATDTYTELLSLLEPCVRSFMVAMQHPFESAYFNLVYTKNSQFRVTIYLPLPERYGVRGGYAIGSTPRRALLLCALNAVDVLCALDVIPPVCLAQPRWQRLLELRAAVGMVLPPSYLYARHLEAATSDAARAALGPPPLPPFAQLRSPPAYRDSPGFNPIIPPPEEVWRIMLMDVDVFDVIPSVVELAKLSHASGVSDYASMPRAFFVEAAAYLFQWRDSTDGLRRHVFQYLGAQRHLRYVRAFANTFWMELPLDKAVYGRRVAVGRCQSRRGAERAMYVHALRILRAMKLAPWDNLDMKQLAHDLYANDFVKAGTQLNDWKWLCATVLDGREDALSQPLNLSVPEAQITSEVPLRSDRKSPIGAETEAAVNMTRVLSPHPVMTQELAIISFT